MYRSQREDHMLVKSCVILPLILSAFERDAKLIATHLRTPAPYLDMLQAAARLATCDLRDVRSEMRRRGVKIYEQRRRPDGIEAKYVCHGFHETMLLLNDTIAAQAAIHMRKYLGLDISAYQSYEDQYQLGVRHSH